MPKINLHKELASILKHNKDGSFSTQSARKDILHMCASELHYLGFYNLTTKGLKPKHIEALVNKWIQDGKSAGTLKNRMSHLRWLSAKIGKSSIVARDNSYYGIKRRQYVTNISKAKFLPDSCLEAVKDEYLRASFILQSAFGLRREEAIKFQSAYALNHEKDGYIRLKDTWCKGGRERYIPITSDEQRNALAYVYSVAGKGSLIPEDLKYIDQVRRYEGECRRLGLSKLHGLRHAYAQSRYFQMTGLKCPADGGKSFRDLNAAEKELDRTARYDISNELGHEREAITAVYLGR